jgi:DNA-binding transcriptional regulator YiaG
MQTSDLVRIAWARNLCRTGDGKAIRLKNALSLQEMADTVGVAPATLRAWEEDHALPRGQHALRWLAVLEALGAEAVLGRTA